MEVRIGEGVRISEVLGVPFSELSRVFEGHIHGKTKSQAEKILSLVQKTGLGHLACGRSLKTLSAGELQRLKLVSGLSALHGNNTLFLLDEPTGGLHSTDIARLLVLFRELTDAGNTIVCVTHEALLMEWAGRVIELGPGGGKDGGRVAVSGPDYTTRWLAGSKRKLLRTHGAP
jgi:excinuclease ABC subunit A